ncbi:MAG: sel1 repeat family protein [Burkholderiaceae bacterium]|nr:sel1 repeat family protein [Rhodoferax sp.]MCP5286790.1 sel1 repeat family protein [Burkholderiaceae bacterium]
MRLNRLLLALWMVAAWATAAPRPPLSPIEQAIGAYARGDVDGARRQLEALARRGLPAADHNLGVMALDQGQPEAAEAHFRRAAGAGFVTAMLALGQLHEQGRLGRRDLPTAMHWYRLAAEGGNVQGMVETGTAHYLGRGAPLDKAQAAHWYREAAKGGDVGAQYLIAAMYETGDGVPQDLRLARYWYGVAADNGDEAAPGKLKELELRELGATAPP